MIYRLIDILQCPIDSGLPLALEVGEEAITDQPYKQPQRCQIHCALEDKLPSFDVCVDRHQKKIVEGTLTCQICSQQFQIADGIPSLIRPDFLDDEHSSEVKDQRAEMETRDSMAARYDSMLPVRWMARSETPAAADILDKVPGESVIELGCGTGEPTVALAQRSNFFSPSISR